MRKTAMTIDMRNKDKIEHLFDLRAILMASLRFFSTSFRWWFSFESNSI